MERVYNGALALLSILAAVFTFIYLQFLEEAGRPDAQAPYVTLLWVIGILVIAVGVCGVWAYIELSTADTKKSPRRTDALLVIFGLALSGVASLPLIIWLLV